MERTSGRELRELEQMARDGLRASNSSLLAFAHLINGRLDKKKAMQPEAEKRCLYTLRDLLHVLAEQYARLAFRLAIHRKQNAIKALNLTDKTGLSKTPVTTDLFGGKWPTFKEAELTRRKERLEAEKAKKANQKKGGGAKGGSNQSFRAPQNSNPNKSSGSQKSGGSSRKEVTEEVEERRWWRKERRSQQGWWRKWNRCRSVKGRFQRRRRKLKGKGRWILPWKSGRRQGRPRRRRV